MHKLIQIKYFQIQISKEFTNIQEFTNAQRSGILYTRYVKLYIHIVVNLYINVSKSLDAYLQ